MLDTTVEKTGVSTLTLGQYVEDYKDYSKQLLECDSKIRIEEATKKAAENAYPQITKLDEKIKQACYIWINAEINKAPAQEKRKILKSYLQKLKGSMRQIKDDTGIDLTKELNDKK